MNRQSEKQNRIGLDYFPVNYLSIKNRNQLLKSIGTKNTTPILNHASYIPNISKKESQYIDSLQNDIKFAPGVTAERCAHLLPYDDRYYDTLYDFKKDPKNKKGNLTQMMHTVPIKHTCVHVTMTKEIPSLPPVRHARVQRDLDSDMRSDNAGNTVGSSDGAENRSKKYWDEYFLSLMSTGTAQYLAFEASHDEAQSKRLQDVVQTWYGPAPSLRELVPEDVENESLKQDIRSNFPYKYYMDLVKSERSGDVKIQEPGFTIDSSPKQRISDLLSREISFYEENQQTDPYGDDTKASFYRLPLFMRRQQKNTEVFDKESCNKTAELVKEFRLPVTPPRRLDTVLNPKIGDKVLMSTNQFQQDLLIGPKNSQKKQLNSSDDVIVLEDKIYRKNLQPIWPTMVTSALPTDDSLDSFKPLRHQLVKGHNRWTDLPEKEESNLQRVEETNEGDEKARLESRKRVRDHSSVNLIVDQWRKKWQLTQKYNDSTVDALLKDMVDAHPTIRMQAVVTVAKSSTHSTSESSGDVERKETMKSDNIPKVLLESIEILLDDSHAQVRKVAAVALHSLEIPSETSMKILRSMLESGPNVDRWTAAQCLALSDAHDSHIIGELVDQLMNSEDFLIHKKASMLLGKISFHTKLAHGMLGEKLNTVSWRQRVIICKTLPLLYGSLNKDILRKLIYLMWQDQHRQVRIAASQAIGKTGNGKAVHDELIKKLENQSEIVRADALEKIGILKVMTTRMMPAFLKCFSDDFVIVRKEVCRTCYRLEIQDDVCIRRLLDIARYDPASRVKIYALRALGKIRVENSEIRACFVWALLYESEVTVRYEALYSLLALKKIDQEVVDILKSRFLVEDDRNVVRLLKKTLISVGINPDEDIDTVAEVKSEVRRFLSDKGHITDVILSNEAEAEYLLQKQLMIAASPENLTEYLCKEGTSKTLKVSFVDTDASCCQSSVNEQDDGEYLIDDDADNAIDDTGEGAAYKPISIDNEMSEDREEFIREAEDEEPMNDGFVQHESEELVGGEDTVFEKEISAEECNFVKDEKVDVKETEELVFDKEIAVEECNAGNEDKEEIKEIEEDNLNQTQKEECKIGEIIPDEGEEKVTVVEVEAIGKEESVNVIDEAMEVNEERIVGPEMGNEGKGRGESDDIPGEDEDGDTEINCVEKEEDKNDVVRRTDLIESGNEAREMEDNAVREERPITDNVERDLKVTCRYRLPSDSSHIKTHSFERSMTWMSFATPMIYTDQSQLESLESGLSLSIMEQVNDAIEFEGIDCGPSTPL